MSNRTISIPSKTSTSRFALRIGALVAIASLIISAAGNRTIAGTVPASDELLITGLGGAPVLAGIVIPETPAAGAEPSAIFAPGLGLGGLFTPGALGGLIPPGGPFSYVILTEPAGPPDAGELPPVTYLDPTGPIVVSDLLINGLLNQGPTGPFVALISDNNPDLATFVAALPPGVPFLPETGALQDLTGFGPSILPSFGPVQIQVLSDVPEPSSLVLSFVSFIALAALSWRRRRG